MQKIFTINRKATRGRETLKLRSREVGAFFEGNLQKAVVTTVLGNIIHTYIYLYIYIYIYIYAHNEYIRVHVHIIA